MLNSTGAQRVMVLADGAPDMTGQIATRKAFTAVTMKVPTAVVSGAGEDRQGPGRPDRQ